MSKKKRKEQTPDNIEAVESVLSRSEQFIEDNQKMLTTVVLVVVAIVGIYLAYQKWYLKPLEEEANYAYMELKETEKAIEYYVKAGTYNENEFVSPIYLLRAGQAMESIEDYEGALKQYKLIKEKYRNSAEGRMIDKYIAKAELLAKK
jgi:tetratricopeptide (TPR) repeat protein